MASCSISRWRMTFRAGTILEQLAYLEARSIPSVVVRESCAQHGRCDFVGSLHRK